MEYQAAEADRAAILVFRASSVRPPGVRLMSEPESRLTPVDRAEPTDASRRALLLRLALSWGLVVGAVAVLVPAVLTFVISWVRGEVFDLAGIAHRRPAPMSAEAAAEAFYLTFFLLVIFGLPLFAFGSIVGAVVGVKKARKRNPQPRRCT